jgi:uncharacterized Tic20 family protein
MADEKVGKTITQNDRIMAALAHVTAILPMMGIVAPIVIWATQKDKSEFVAFQALQAVAYQLTIILAWFIGMGCYMCSFFGMFIAGPFSASSGSDVPVEMIGMFFPLLVMGIMMLGSFVFIVYGVIAAIRLIQGKDFRYIVIGDRIKSYLGGDGSGSEK